MNSRNGKPYLYATVAIIGVEKTKDITLEMNKQYSVKLVQVAGIFSVNVNGQQVWQVNSGSSAFQNVKYYLSNPWHPSAGEVAILSEPKIQQGQYLYI